MEENLSTYQGRVSIDLLTVYNKHGEQQAVSYHHNPQKETIAP